MLTSIAAVPASTSCSPQLSAAGRGFEPHPPHIYYLDKGSKKFGWQGPAVCFDSPSPTSQPTVWQLGADSSCQLLCGG